MNDLTIHRGKTDVTPETVGYKPGSIEFLDNHFKGLVMSGKLQGASYLLGRKEKIFACASMGKQSAFKDTGDLMPDSIRPVTSMTKVFTATAIMQLVEQGKTYIEQPVMEVIDEFNTASHRNITIFHLLTHTSGLPGSPGYFCEPYPHDFPDYLDKNWIINGLKGVMQAKPGEAWNYSSYGFAILGEIIRRVSGICFHDYIMEHIIKPLGMDHTFFIVPEHLRDTICLVTEHDRTMNDPSRKHNPVIAAGGIQSTLYDLFIFCRMMCNKGIQGNKRILSRKSVETATRNHLHNVYAFAWGVECKDKKYGLGWSMAYRSLPTPGTFFHEGAGRSAMFIDPVEDLITIYFIPTPIAWVPESLISPLGIIWGGLE